MRHRRATSPRSIESRNYDSRTQHFDTSAVETVLQQVMGYNQNAVIVIKGSLCVYQGVTIGGSGKSKKIDGKEIWQPIIEDGVTIYSNAMVLGPIHISKNSIIKAGERVTVDCYA